MSSSGGKSSEQFSFAAPGGNASQSSPGSITGASSADAATVITMPSTSQISGEGGVAPRETTSTGSDVRMGNAKRVMKRFTRPTSPRTTSRRSPKRDIERVEIEDAKDFEERERERSDSWRNMGFCVWIMRVYMFILGIWHNFKTQNNMSLNPFTMLNYLVGGALGHS